MNGADYISLSLATVLERSLDVTANNIANLSTSGFKAGRPLLETQNIDDGRREGGSISYTQDRGSYLDLEQGALARTDNALDVAISGRDWFSYATEGDRPAYGRDGRLVISPDGALTTTMGAAILDAGGSPITLPVEPGSDFVIARDGTITNASGVVYSQIGLVSIEAPEALQSIGNGLYHLPEGMTGTQSQSSSILQGFLEQSNVQGTLEITRMMEIQRAYERAVKVMDETNELTRTAIQRISQRV